MLPSGATLENIEELWDKLNFRKATTTPLTSASTPAAPPSNTAVSTASDSVSNQAGGKPSPTINPDNFRSPDKRIEFLRSVARSGREHTEALADQRKGMPRLVWGEGEPWVDEHGVFDELESESEQAEVVASAAVASTEVASETLEALPEALSDGVVGDVAQTADADADISHDSDISAVEVDVDQGTVEAQSPPTDHTTVKSHELKQDDTGNASVGGIRGVPGSGTPAMSG